MRGDVNSTQEQVLISAAPSEDTEDGSYEGIYVELATEQPVQQSSKQCKQEPFNRGTDVGSLVCRSTDEFCKTVLDESGAIPVSITVDRLSYVDLSLTLVLLSGKHPDSLSMMVSRSDSSNVTVTQRSRPAASAAQFNF